MCSVENLNLVLRNLGFQFFEEAGVDFRLVWRILDCDHFRNCRLREDEDGRGRLEGRFGAFFFLLFDLDIARLGPVEVRRLAERRSDLALSVDCGTGNRLADLYAFLPRNRLQLHLLGFGDILFLDLSFFL